MTKENWLDIPGFEASYQVSDLGRIRSIKGKSNLLSPYNCHGYRNVDLSVHGVLTRHVIVHRIVALVFIPNPLNKPWVNHENGIKWDNRKLNLNWSTQRENVNHAIRTGLIWVPPHYKQKLLRTGIHLISNGELSGSWATIQELKNYLSQL